MKAMSKSTKIISIILCFIILCSCFGCMIASFLKTDSDGILTANHINFFSFFTSDSNLLMSVAALISVICLIRSLKDPDKPFPKWAEILNFISTGAVSLTFLTCCAFLGPILGYAYIYSGTNFFLHLLSPVSAIVLFMFFCVNYRISLRCTLLCIIPTFIYASVYFVMVVLIGLEKGGWADFYMFNAGGRWYISFPVMLLVTYLIGLGLRVVHNLVLKHRSR